jgi:hypothetical protein
MDNFEKAAAELFGTLNVEWAGVDLQDRPEITVWFFRIGEGSGNECCDNRRVAKAAGAPEVGSAEALSEYWKAQSRGCCGSTDTAVTCSSGTRYLIGCNYGH